MLAKPTAAWPRKVLRSASRIEPPTTTSLLLAALHAVVTRAADQPVGVVVADEAGAAGGVLRSVVGGRDGRDLVVELGADNAVRCPCRDG